MKKCSKTSPPGAYRIEPNLGHPGEVCIRLFANAEKVTVETHWEYDEYQLIVPYSDNLAADIETNYDKWMKNAKMNESGIGRGEDNAAIQEQIIADLRIG